MRGWLASRGAALAARLGLARPPPPPPPTPHTPLHPILVALPVFVLLAGLKRALGKRSAASVSPERGIMIGSIMSFLSITAAAVTFPFMHARRDKLGCDALCQGGQTSLQSGLSLVGAALVGRASDRFGRIPMLWLGFAATLLSLSINLGMNSLTGMWCAIIPVALLNQNWSVSKALFSDYITQQGGSDADRAGAVGKLGMAIGVAIMAGPLLATAFVTEYTEALELSAAFTLAAGALILMLPSPVSKGTARGAPAGWTEFLRLPVLQTRGVQLMILMRLLMGLGFHMYAPIWQVSLRKRFAFGPKDHAQFMAVIGLTYSLSQGLIAKPLMELSRKDPSRLVLCCILFLGGARPFALYSQSLALVYSLYVPMVIALGTLNTVITTACSSQAGGDQLGGLFGVLESVEAVTGIFGPALGGLLTSYSELATVVVVCGCYGLLALIVFFSFNKHIVHVDASEAEKQKSS